VLRLGETERIEIAGGIAWRPLRRALGVTGFGVNAYTADAGQEAIEDHDETGAGAGGHEEMYVVMSGRALFTVAGEEIDADAGTFVFIPERSARRHAVASEDGTAILAIGGPAGAALPVSPWEYWMAAEPAYQSGDYERAIEIASQGLADHPDHGHLHYQLACYHALAGPTDEATRHLRRAYEIEPKTREWAAGDSDLDSVRDLA
jgi:tetratricopeptide (TPR) repeat protein